MTYREEYQVSLSNPVGFFVLKSGIDTPESEIENELIQKVRPTIGPAASFKRVVRVERLSNTRSGKILRKIMRAISAYGQSSIND